MPELICYDFYCGLGGWAEGFLAEGYECIGFDIEAHDYGTSGYPGKLIIRDVRSIHGSELKHATVFVASPPCQEPSYRAMPWKRAKALPPPDNTLFNECFRIQRDASEAAGHYIPLIVENVVGAQRWVGKARWHYGSYYLWGDVPALMPIAVRARKFNPDGSNHPSGSWFAIADSKNRGSGRSFQTESVAHAPADGYKSAGMDWSDRSKRGQDFTRVAWNQALLGRKDDGSGWTEKGTLASNNRLVYSSKSMSRKAASAMIAKIPPPLSQHIASCFKAGAHDSRS